MTAPDQPKAPPTQRMRNMRRCRFGGDDELCSCDGLTWHKDCPPMTDAEVTLADAQTALAARNARIEELSRQLYNERRQGDEMITALLSEAKNAVARADRLEAQLQAARAAGTREDGLREAITDCERRVFDCSHGQEVHSPAQAADALARTIRARLTAPAEPTADTGEKG